MREKKMKNRVAKAVYFHHQTVMAVVTESKQQRRDEVQFNRRCIKEIVWWEGDKEDRSTEGDRRLAMMSPYRPRISSWQQDKERECMRARDVKAWVCSWTLAASVFMEGLGGIGGLWSSPLPEIITEATDERAVLVDVLESTSGIPWGQVGMVWGPKSSRLSSSSRMVSSRLSRRL